MSIFVEACKEYTRGKQQAAEIEDRNKTNVFNLRESIRKERAAYVKDRSEESKRKEDKLLSFILTPEYYNFLFALLDYCRELFRLENKQQVLQQEARQRDLAEPQILPSEKKKLNEKAIKMA